MEDAVLHLLADALHDDLLVGARLLERLGEPERDVLEGLGGEGRPALVRRVVEAGVDLDAGEDARESLGGDHGGMLVTLLDARPEARLLAAQPDHEAAAIDDLLVNGVRAAAGEHGDRESRQQQPA